MSALYFLMGFFIGMIILFALGNFVGGITKPNGGDYLKQLCNGSEYEIREEAGKYNLYCEKSVLLENVR